MSQDAPPPPAAAAASAAPPEVAGGPLSDAAASAGPLSDAPPHPSAAALSRLDLPLSPVVAPPLDRNNSLGGSQGLPAQDALLPGSPFVGAAAAAVSMPDAAMPGSPTSPRSPLRSSGSSRFFSLANVRRPSTEVWAFGRGDCGQLGSGGMEDSHVPRRMDGLKGRDILSVSAGTLHTAAVTADGELYVCGSNDAAQLGIRSSEGASSPTRVTALESFTAHAATCGPSCTLAIVDDGAVAAVGSNEFGELGLGAESTQVDLPRVIKDLRSMHVVRLAAGGGHCLALSSTGGVFSFGNGSFGALGRGTSQGTDIPRPISRLWPLGVVQVACGESHSAALTADGRLLTWGRGKYGALGQGDVESRSPPQAVRSLAGVVGRQVSCGDDHTVLLAEDGSVYTWGRGTWGQTGQGHTDNVSYPKQVAALAGHRIIQVCAGGRHTLCLDSRNQLWAFGCGDSGQLGQPPSSCQPVPQRVQGLPEGPILFVAAGSDHSIVVIDRGGRVEAAAIGPCATRRPHGDQWCPVPLPDLLELTEEAAALKGKPEQAQEARERLEAVVAAVEMVFASPGYLLAAFAAERRGGQYGQAAQQQHEEQQGGQQQVQRQQGPAADGAAPMDVDESGRQQQQGQQPEEQQLGQQGRQQQGQQQGQQEDGQLGQQPPGVTLDLPRIAATYQALLKLYDPAVVNALGSTCVRLLDMVERFLNSLAQQQRDASGGSTEGRTVQPRQDLGWLAPALFVLLQSPLNGEVGSFGSKLLMRICRIVAVTTPAQERLPMRQALQKLLARLPADTLAARCVRPVQRYIDSCVAAGLGASRVQLIMAGVLLDMMRQANEDQGGPIPYTEFQNRALSEHCNLQLEYLSWLQNKDKHALVSLCQMPYLLTPEAKSRIMHGEAALQQQQHLSAAALQALFQGVNPASVAFLEIQVRRTHVVEDALNQLVHREEDLKKPLRVTFISGGVPEPAQDEGGVTKELFQLLTRDLFRPEFGMFTYDEQTRTYWFNPASLESELEYALVGAVLGLAIYNGVILDVHFPAVAYKKLLAEKPTFQDLKAAFPQLGRGLQQLLDFEGDVEAVFCRSFAVELDFYGELRTHELKPGGADIPVTAANRQEYVELYTKWLLEGSVEEQFAAFRRGFLRVCDGPALTLFTPPELEILICGTQHLDFGALQKVARYEGGYTSESQAVRWFWEIILGLPLDQKRSFLQFTTGSDRAPVGGLGRMQLLIQRAGPDTDRLPTSHTCFNALLLPDYASKEKMRRKLLTAVENSQGFGLQ